MVIRIQTRYRVLIFSIVVIIIIYQMLRLEWRFFTDRRSGIRKHILYGDLQELHPLKGNGYKQPCSKRAPWPLGEKTSQSISENESSVPNFDEIIEANQNLINGGRFSPGQCDARHKVAIIIPYRQRELQLRGLLAHMHPIWQRQQLEYKVYIVTQVGDGLFNRAKLLNAGFLEASKDDDYNCFVFHDVDILLENDRCSYHCLDSRSQVKHLSVYLDKYDYQLRRYPAKCPPTEYDMKDIVNFGGIMMMSSEQFHEVNGFSNIYWGWGGEDDEMALRVWKKGFQILRDDACRYRMYKHDRGKVNFLKKRILNSCFKRMETDGLSSMTYKVLSKQLHRLFTNITVDIGSPSPALVTMFEDKYERRSCDGDVFLDRKRIW